MSVPSNAGAEWYPKSRTSCVHGYQIEGMVYVGAALPAVKGEGIEPALINPCLSVRKPGPSYHGSDLYFWPSYANISPQARGRYLEWLADGRKDSRIEIGFVFLFFYGLERRLLVDECHAEERAELISEVERLRAIYRRNVSFENYSSRLLDFVRANQLEDVREQAPPPVLRQWDKPYSSTLQISLGYFAATGVPVPASWALAWAESHPGYRQRTPAERCRQEFEEIFRIRYTSQFPHGCVLHANDPGISFEYHPASASFGGPITAQSDFQDVTLCTEPGTTLKNIAMDCIEQLDAYSRHLGRNPQARESAVALALLPEFLFRTHTVVADLRSWLDSTLQDSFALADYRILLDRCSVTASDKAITKKDLTLLAQFLERLHVGIEPDPRFGPVLPERDGKIVLFRLGKDQPTTATTGYSAASMLLTLGAAVATADGEVTAEEKERLERQIRTFDLPAAASLRLRAQTQWLLNGGVRFSFVRKLLEGAPVDDSRVVAEFLLEVARADGEINVAEIDILSKIYRLLRLDPKTLFSAAHKLATESPLRPTADAPRNITPYAEQASAGSRVAIDMDKVATKNAESERVSVLLREIFVQDENPSPAERIAREHILGLDSRQATFLAELLKRPSWSRADLEGLAMECHVLLEGTVDAINDAALNRYEDLLVEGDDPILLNPTIAKELSNERH